MPSEGLGTVTGALDFRAASQTILHHLHAGHPMSAWCVTRVVGDDYVVLSSTGDAAPREGERYEWNGSLCSAMVSGDGPRVAPRLTDVPVYDGTGFADVARVASYLGVPLVGRDGVVAGTLCAVHTEPQQNALYDVLPVVELQAQLLSSILAAELEVASERRRAERAELVSMIDPLTGAANRRGWEALLAAEEERCRSYGDHAAVLILDLDGLKAVNDTYGHPAGDEMLRLTNQVLESCLREADAV